MMSSTDRCKKACEFWEKTLNGARLIVAPMVDQSELAWRMLCRKYGAQLCYTPMFHASNFVRDAHYRKEALTTCTEDSPLIMQFCANDPDTLLEAATIAQSHCDAIDLNLGCPQSIAKRGHYGAFLQDEWDLVASLVKKCAEHLTVPITCKIRVFESVERTVEYAECIQNAGCQLLTVHGRTREQKGFDTGLASWDHIKAVRERLSIPVFANGNIQYFGDIERCMTSTGVDGVMVAEGNLHNPALFMDEAPPCWQMAEEYLRYVDLYPCPVSYVRGHIFKLNHHALQRHTDIRDLFTAAKSIECFKLANVKLKEKCMLDEHDQGTSADMLTDHGLPYWICQPYVRPKPTEMTARLTTGIDAKRELLKRPLELIFAGIDFSTLSKKKMKRMLKYPQKNHRERLAARIEKCAQCDNTKGSRCLYDLCKYCCRIKAFRDILDCSGHNFMVKTKTDGRREYEEKTLQLSRACLPDSGDTNTVDTTDINDPPDNTAEQQVANNRVDGAGHLEQILDSTHTTPDHIDAACSDVVVHVGDSNKHEVVAENLDESIG